MKVLIRILCIVLVAFMLIGCSKTGVVDPLASDTTGAPVTTTDTEADTKDSEPDTTSLEEKARISEFIVDYEYYKTVQALVEKADNIIEGKITNVFFDFVCRFNNGSNNAGFTAFDMITIYEVEVGTSYKGENAERVYIAVSGGIAGYKESEQIAKMKEYGVYKGYIPVMHNFEHMKIGSTYIFCATSYCESYFRIISNYQAIYNPSEPDKTSRHNHLSYNEVKSYLTFMQEDER